MSNDRRQYADDRFDIHDITGGYSVVPKGSAVLGHERLEADLLGYPCANVI